MTDIAKRAVLGDVTNVASPVRIVKPTAPEKGSDGAPRPAGVSSEVVAAINAKIAELKNAGAIKIPVVEGAVSDQTSNATVKPLKPLDGTGRKDAPVDEKWVAVVQAINDACAELKQAGILMIAPTAITLSDAKLGEGGNGTVCVGQVCLPDKTCDFAVKLLAATGSKDAKSTLRDFRNELLMGHRAAAKHRKGQPSRIAETICGAVEIRKASVRFFIVMEQVKCAKDLADFIQEQCHWKALRHEGLDTGAKLARNFIEVERGPQRNVFAYVMSRERKLILAIEVVRALLELSRAGMVHLDWKPANVLVTTKSADLRKSKPSEPLLKLIDFGEAAVATVGDGKLDYTTGTQGYAAPEMEYGMAPLAADVFSVGVTLLELWVGCLWHGAKTEPGCAKERVVALQKVHMTDPTIARLLTECLSPEPKLRPTALQLLARLKKVQRQRVVY